MARPSFTDSKLLEYLKELKNEDLRNFKVLLWLEHLRHHVQPIDKNKVQHASRKDLARLMCECYPEKQAWEMATNILVKIDRQDLWKKAQEENGYKKNPYKERMKEKFHLLWKKETCLPVPDNFYKETVKAAFEELKKVFTSAETSKEGALSVVLGGPEGIGKTTFLRNAMIEWAEGKLWMERFPCVFFLDGREMNQVAESSLVELLSRDWPKSSTPIETILLEPQDILFIVDGFEEFKCNLMEVNGTCDKWNQKQPIEVILRSLLQKKMLPDSSLLIAFGPLLGKWKLLLKHPKEIVLSGFSEEERRIYFSHFFHKKNEHREAFGYVREMKFLLFLCQNPFSCWMVCSCIKRQLERAEDVTIACENVTSLYVSFLTNVMKAGANFPPWQWFAQMKGLCSLAAEGMWTQTYLFCLEDLGRHGVSEFDISLWLDRSVLRRNGDCVSFIHGHMQAFCAAMFYLLKQPQDHTHSGIGNLAKLLTASLSQPKSHLSRVVQFAFGLSTEAITTRLEMTFGFQLPQDIKREVIQCAAHIRQCQPCKTELDFQELFYYICENREEFVTHIMGVVVDITVDIENKNDLLIASHGLARCRNVQKLRLCINDLFSNDSGPIARTAWQAICSVLNTNKNLIRLELVNCSLDDDTMAVFCRAMEQAVCKLEFLVLYFVSGFGHGMDFFKAILDNPYLKYLNLHGTALPPTAVGHLCQMLKHPLCNIETLLLGSCGITEVVIQDIVSVFISNKKLKHLSFIENPLGDAGAMTLCNVLTRVHAPLEKLILNDCCLSFVSCQYIYEVLLWNQTLAILDLGSNVLGINGIYYLCEALKNPHCCLQELWLTNCFLTPECCISISSALVSNQHLKILKLGNNHILDDGAKQLCVALKHPNCKLQKLGLDMCGLTSACSKDLASVLIGCKTLRMLSLDGISLDFNGMRTLCVALCYQECALQTLGLNKEVFDEKNVLLLKFVERRNSHLTITNQPWLDDEYNIRGTLY